MARKTSCLLDTKENQPKRNYKHNNENNLICLPVSSSKLLKSQNIKIIKPLTNNQETFFEIWNDSTVEGIVLYGSAGTGKSFLSMYKGLKSILDENSQYTKLIIIRSCVQSRNMGFTKGTQQEKLEPYELPYIDICKDLFGRSDAYSKLKNSKKIEFLSTSFLRGCSFDNAIILFDEFQSENWHGISTVLTRVGNNSKIILCGDIKQNDLIHNKNDVSGFIEFMNVSKKMIEFRHIEFTKEDIVRSSFVKSFIVACETCGL